MHSLPSHRVSCLSARPSPPVSFWRGFVDNTNSISIQAQTMNSATLRLFSLAWFDLRCFKSDFYAVKSIFGLLIE